MKGRTLRIVNISGVRRVAKIVLGDVTVQKVSVEAGNAPALLQDANATQMFAGIAGLGKHCHLYFHLKNLYKQVFVQCFGCYLVHLTLNKGRGIAACICAISWLALHGS